MLLDIITPLYHSMQLSRLLQSITSSKYLQDINLVLISDGDNYDYSPVLDAFPQLNICFLSYTTNGGPGIARQYGLDNSFAPFVTFIDSDDIFLSKGVDTIVETIQQHPNNYLYLFKFIENEQVCSKEYNYGTMGQIYAREFLDKYNIRFPSEEPYYLEDYGFNLACRYIMQYFAKDKIFQMNAICSKTVGHSDSITHKSYNEFIYKNWARGSAWNSSYAIMTALECGVPKEQLLFDASKFMAEQYWFYCIAYIPFPGYRHAIMEGCIYYYNHCYKYFREQFGDKMAMELWNNDYAPKIKNTTIKLDFFQFLERCKTL